MALKSAKIGYSPLKHNINTQIVKICNFRYKIFKKFKILVILLIFIKIV